MAVELFVVLENQLGVPIPPSQLIENPTIQKAATSIANILEHQEGTPSPSASDSTPIAGAMTAVTVTPEDDLERQLKRLTTEITPLGSPATGPPRNILLTGVTGFFGPHLLAELLRTSEASIHCLVRAGSEKAAWKRIRDRLESANLRITKKSARRIVAVPGDVSRPTLGLSATRWNRLSQEIDTIIHGAASVTHASDYGELRSTDVMGTFETLRLAAAEHPKHFYYFSSISVFSAEIAHASAARDESAMPDPLATLFNGYGQCKAVSEHLIRAAANAGIPARVFRLGHLVSESEPARSASNQALWLVLRACLYLEFAPEYRGNLQITPVEWTAAAIAQAVEHRIPPDTWHVASSHSTTFDDVLVHCRDLGYSVKTLGRKEWVTRLARLAGDQQGRVYARLFPDAELAHIPISEAGLLDDDRFRLFLGQRSDQGVRFPQESWDAASLLDELKALGFLPDPQANGPQKDPATQLAVS